MMKAIILLLLVSSSLVAAIDGVISMKLQRSTRGAPMHPLSKRSGPVSVSAVNVDELGYSFANITVGTPPQYIALIIENVESDTFVFAPGACNVGESDPNASCIGGNFNSSASSTFNLTSAGGGVEYGNFTSDAVTETIGFSGALVKNFPMSVISNTTVQAAGILGLGFPDSSISDTTSTNILDYMVAQGLIATRAFSLWIDNLDSPNGNLLFGGIDSAKFTTPTLAAVPLLHPLTSDPGYYHVAWTSFDVQTGANFTSDPNAVAFSQLLPLTATVYTNSYYNFVPVAMFSYLSNLFGVYGNASSYYIPCSVLDQPGRLRFGFGSSAAATIDMLYSQLGIRFTADKGTQLCQFAFRGSSAFTWFGTPFLRSAYVVYDVDNNQLGIAQAVVNATGSNITAIPVGANPLIVAGANFTNGSTVSSSSKPATVTATETATAAGGASGTSSAAAGSSTAKAGAAGLSDTGVVGVRAAVLGFITVLLGSALMV